MVINCIPRWFLSSESRICGTYQKKIDSDCTNHPQRTKVSLLNALMISQTASCFPAAQEWYNLNALYQEAHFPHHREDGVLNRCDIAAETATVQPVFRVMNGPHSYCIRTTEERELIGGEDSVEQIAEDSLWHEASDTVSIIRGLRDHKGLPLFLRKAYRCRKLMKLSIRPVHCCRKKGRRKRDYWTLNSGKGFPILPFLRQRHRMGGGQGLRDACTRQMRSQKLIPMKVVYTYSIDRMISNASSH